MIKELISLEVSISIKVIFLMCVFQMALHCLFKEQLYYSIFSLRLKERIKILTLFKKIVNML